MKYGINLLLWSARLEESLLEELGRLKQFGFDGVEIPIFDTQLDTAYWSRQLDGLGLERTAVTIRGPEDNPISPNRSIRQRGVEQTCRTLDVCHELGVTHLVGPYHSALGVFTGAGPTEDEWRWGVESMRHVAEHAAQANVVMGLEPLNRFETYLLCTHADAGRFAAAVDHPNCRVMYDTFHANIEEKNIPQSIRDCGPLLCHVHISENDRSTPGSGNVRWAETFDALYEVGYDGWLMVEAFGLALPEIAAATKIWRRMFDSSQQLARDALRFMKQQVASRWG